MNVSCEHVIRGDQVCGKPARYVVLIYDLRPPHVALGMIERWYTGIRARCEDHVRDLFANAAATERKLEEVGEDRHFRGMVKLPDEYAEEVRRRQEKHRAKSRGVRKRNRDGTPRFKDPQ